ncbi:hypothetical protein HGO21_29350 [Acinetobacter sp. CUI P1]|nr:hypothetical protein [Acinetobacter sp. CUI P1]
MSRSGYDRSALCLLLLRYYARFIAPIVSLRNYLNIDTVSTPVRAQPYNAYPFSTSRAAARRYYLACSTNSKAAHLHGVHSSLLPLLRKNLRDLWYVGREG